MKRSLLVSIVGLIAALSSAASAADSPSVSKLQVIEVPDMLHPRDAPDGVASTERIEGVRVDRQSFNPQHSFLSLSGIEGRCVTIGAAPPGIAPSGAGVASIRAGGGALPLRVERLVAKGPGEASLELVDGWIDVKTQGMRETRTTRIPLTVLGKGPAGYEVYGFRSAGVIQVVLPAQERLAYVDERGGIGVTSCGHVRLTLDPSQRAGSMIVAAGRVKLPKQASRTAALPRFGRAEAAVAQAPMPQVPVPVDSFAQMRGIQISVSASRTKREQDPLFSVSAGWAEEEQGASPEPAMNGPMPQESFDLGDE
jgi:hypothetical protein